MKLEGTVFEVSATASVGVVEGNRLRFRYAQREQSGEIHGGRSRCDIETLSDGRRRVYEHFQWETRDGSGTNVFDEVAGEARFDGVREEFGVLDDGATDG